jgi:hypothetical protein
MPATRHPIVPAAVVAVDLVVGVAVATRVPVLNLKAKVPADIIPKFFRDSVAVVVAVAAEAEDLVAAVVVADLLMAAADIADYLDKQV